MTIWVLNGTLLFRPTETRREVPVFEATLLEEELQYERRHAADEEEEVVGESGAGIARELVECVDGIR